MQAGWSVCQAIILWASGSSARPLARLTCKHSSCSGQLIHMNMLLVLHSHSVLHMYAFDCSMFLVLCMLTLNAGYASVSQVQAASTRRVVSQMPICRTGVALVWGLSAELLTSIETCSCRSMGLQPSTRGLATKMPSQLCNSSLMSLPIITATPQEVRTSCSPCCCCRLFCEASSAQEQQACTGWSVLQHQ